MCSLVGPQEDEEATSGWATEERHFALGAVQTEGGFRSTGRLWNAHWKEGSREPSRGGVSRPPHRLLWSPLRDTAAQG